MADLAGTRGELRQQQAHRIHQADQQETESQPGGQLAVVADHAEVVHPLHHVLDAGIDRARKATELFLVGDVGAEVILDALLVGGFQEFFRLLGGERFFLRLLAVSSAVSLLELLPKRAEPISGWRWIWRTVLF